MGWLAGLLRPRATLDPLDDKYYVQIGSGGQALTGVYVSAESALSVAAVWACVRVISDPLGWLPLIMYRRQDDGGRRRADWHPLYTLLHDQPNPWQTAQDWRKLMTVYALLRGDGLSRIVPGPRGLVDQLIPIHPDRVVKIAQAKDYTLRYEIRKAGSLTETEILLQDEVFHLRGLSLDGLRGVSVVEYARQTLGLGLATEQYAARFYSQNATPAGLLIHPGKPSREARKKIKSEWEEDIGGLYNAHRTAVVAEGIDYKPISMSHQDSQFLESRQFEVEEIARWFGVPLHKIQSQSKATSWGSGIEEMNQDFITSALAPWAQAWQQAISRDLILDPTNYYAEFLFDALSKGRLLDRYQAFHLALTDGWMNRNEVRAIENRNRADGLDDFLFPANMLEVGEESEPEPKPEPAMPGPPTPEDTDEEEQGRTTDGHYRALLEEAAGRVVRKELAALTKAARRAGEDFETFEREVREFYSDHAEFVAQTLRMPLDLAQGYVDQQREVALRFGMPAVTMDEVTTVGRLCELARNPPDGGMGRD